jgi:hypothetical protein
MDLSKDSRCRMNEQLCFELAFRRHLIGSRWCRAKERFAARAETIARLLGAEYWCIGTGGCGLRCKRPPKTAMGPFCPSCLSSVHRTSKVTWADEVPWAGHEPQAQR